MNVLGSILGLILLIYGLSVLPDAWKSLKSCDLQNMRAVETSVSNLIGPVVMLVGGAFLCWWTSPNRK